MAFNGTTIPRALVTQVMTGLANKEKARAAADLVCVRVPVPQTSGTVTVEPSLLSVPISNGGGVAEGAVVKRLAGALGKLNYNLLVYKQTAAIDVGDEVSAGAAGYNLLTNRMAMCQEVANLKLDIDFETVLGSTALNLTYNVTASDGVAWSTPATSDPFGDLRKVLKLCPGLDTLVIGIDVIDVLAVHPDFTAESSNYSGGSLADDAVVKILKDKLRGVRDVFVVDRFYNQAAEGQDIDLKYIFPKGVWAGHRADLPIMELNQQNPRPINTMDEEAETRIVGYSRRSEVQRPHKEMGVTITNAVA